MCSKVSVQYVLLVLLSFYEVIFIFEWEWHGAPVNSPPPPNPPHPTLGNAHKAVPS